MTVTVAFAIVFLVRNWRSFDRASAQTLCNRPTSGFQIQILFPHVDICLKCCRSQKLVSNELFQNGQQVRGRAAKADRAHCRLTQKHLRGLGNITFVAVRCITRFRLAQKPRYQSLDAIQKLVAEGSKYSDFPEKFAAHLGPLAAPLALQVSAQFRCKMEELRRHAACPR